MLALLGLLTILVLLTAIIGKWMSPLVALIAVPIVASLIGGFGLHTGKFIVSGIKDVAPVAGMFIFAILYFGVMTDAGMLDPIIDWILRTVGSRPTRIVPGTALLALLMAEGKLQRQPIYIGGLGRVFTEIYDLESHRTHRQYPNLHPAGLRHRFRLLLYLPPQNFHLYW